MLWQTKDNAVSPNKGDFFWEKAKGAYMASKDKISQAREGAYEARSFMGRADFLKYLRRELRISEPLATRMANQTPIPLEEAPKSAINTFAGLVGISRRSRGLNG